MQRDGEHEPKSVVKVGVASEVSGEEQPDEESKAGTLVSDQFWFGTKMLVQSNILRLSSSISLSTWMLSGSWNPLCCITDYFFSHRYVPLNG